MGWKFCFRPVSFVFQRELCRFDKCCGRLCTNFLNGRMRITAAAGGLAMTGEAEGKARVGRDAFIPPSSGMNRRDQGIAPYAGNAV